MYRHGWYQIAFESELTGPLSPAAVGRRRLVVLRDTDGLRVADALCPHRGANLAYGGHIDDGAVVCPFHGFHIGVGVPGEEGLCVKTYPSLVVGGLVFVRLSPTHDNGFADRIAALARERTVLPGFTLQLGAASEMVIENAFDQGHFHPVHGIGINGAFAIRPSRHGEFAVDGHFELPSSPWQRGRDLPEARPVPFTAEAFSPGIVLSHLGGAHPYGVVTAATPTAEGDCTIRLSLVLEPDEAGRPPPADLVEFLLRRSRAGLDRDRAIWMHRSEAVAARYTARDAPVRAFREFCTGFAEAAPP